MTDPLPWIASPKQAAAAVFLDRNTERYLSGVSALEIYKDPRSLRAGKLPALHSDPFDRMLVAQAIVHGMTILTPDPEIERYTVRVFW